MFDDGTLLLEDAPEPVPYAEWDDHVNEYRARAHHYRTLRAWAEADSDGQATLHASAATVYTLEYLARAYSDLQLTPAVATEPMTTSKPLS